MGNRFAEIAFTPSVRAAQEAMGSRSNYAAIEKVGEASNGRLTPQETAFIKERDSFYISSVSETGWPYVQHRGGPPGFLKVLSTTRIGFADYRGNRQYVSVGNIAKDDRVALILVDYPHRTRLKILGHAREVSVLDSDMLTQLATPSYRARVERGFVIDVAAFDWNCPQHITPRYTQAMIDQTTAPLNARIAFLEHQLLSSSRQ